VRARRPIPALLLSAALLATAALPFAIGNVRADALPPAARNSDAGTLVKARYIAATVAALGAPAPALRQAQFAQFGSHAASPEVRRLADWVADARDAAGSGFVILDKTNARIYVFDAAARLQAASPVLLGAARGDESVPGIGTRPIPLVKPEERTTPAGRFVAEPGHNSFGEDIVWVDYDAAVSMHRVRATNPKERRLERLATPTSADNRISYGCINVPAAFYERHVRPAFAGKRGIVYVLPEVKSIAQVFGAYDVAAKYGAGRPAPAAPAS
jgi:hypothetical protein